MGPRTIRAAFGLACLGIAFATGRALAQETSPAANDAPARTTSSLGVRQQRVERMLEDLQRKFRTLADSLGKTEPERAERLKQALNESQRMLLQERMDKIARLLDQAQLESATSDQKAVLADIRELLELLLNEKEDHDKAREEYERLDRYRKQIEQLLQRERTEKRESDRLANKDKTLAELAERIKTVEALIREQQQIIESTESARGEGIQAFGKVADQQSATRKKSQAIADQMAEEAGDPKPSDAPLPSDAPSEPSSDGASSPRTPEPGEKPLRQAIDNQQNATANLQQGKGKGAQQDEEAALDDLKRTLAELKNESSRIASLPPEAFEKMANRQEDIAAETGKLGEEMKQPGSSGKSGGQSGDQKPTPGQQSVEKAQGNMQKASGDLQGQQPADASRQQGKAIKDLEEALREIEERLAQLREETQIEKLARLEARFREMLSRQQKATTDTAELEKKRQASGGDLKRSDRLALGKVAAEELALSEAAQQALDIIIDDGTSVVFADVVEHLRDDLKSLARLLDDKRTDPYTATLQKEVETTLEELIEALQQAQKQKESSGGGGGGGGGGNQPLLPGSAELKLLRSAQLRINRRTTAIDTARSQASGLDNVMKEEIQNLSQRQAEIGEMTIRILERTSGQ